MFSCMAPQQIQSRCYENTARDCELVEINLSLFAINSLRALGGDLTYRLDSSDTAFQFGVQLKYTSGTCFFEKTTFITG